MKVGIITFHRALNYGAVLQAYALQQYLNDIGIENEIIDYRCEYIEEFYKPVKASPLRELKTYIRELLFFPYNTKKRKKFESFVKEYIKTSETIYTQDKLRDINDKYDFFITGSDQVWNSRWSGFDKAYFLDFTENDKKASYAASFGFDKIPENEVDEYRRLLSGFQYISVRENTGLQIINQLLQRNAELSLDPTCLIGKDKWKSIAVKPNESGYVLLYTLDKSEQLVSFAKEKAKELKAKIVCISDALKKAEDFEYKGFLSPSEFIGLFENAGYVVTNSFHGLMFSVIFEKHFCLQYQLSKGAPNSRLADFVHDFGLENCVYQDSSAFTGKSNYAQVSAMMSEKKKKTEEYFENIFNIKKNKNIVLPVSKSQCCGCRACEQICPRAAITMRFDDEGFLYPKIDYDQCINCNQCVSVCVFKEKHLPELPKQPKRTIVAYHTNEEKRLRSRSGGLFVAITDKLLEEGAVIYGVKLNKDFSVIHARAIDEKGRNEFCGSKYVQSDTRNTFAEVYQDLKAGRRVVFSGTACQVAGLKRFLKLKNSSCKKLVTIDIVCHGVMSPLVWKENLREMESRISAEISAVNFRDKSFGWNTHIETYQTKEEKIQSERYTAIFYSHRALRPCCYICPYASTERVSDITLADAWGVEKAVPEWDSVKGISLVLVNTDLGMSLIQVVQQKIVLKYVDLKLMMQPNLLAPTVQPLDRDKFWEEFNRKGYSSVADRCEREQIHIKLKNQRKARIVWLLKRIHLK